MGRASGRAEVQGMDEGCCEITHPGQILSLSGTPGDIRGAARRP